MSAICIGFKGEEIMPHEYAWELSGRKWWLFLYGDPSPYTLTLGPAKTKRALCRKWKLKFKETEK